MLTDDSNEKAAVTVLRNYRLFYNIYPPTQYLRSLIYKLCILSEWALEVICAVS